MSDVDWGMEMEAIEQERFDADIEQAGYVAEGREFARREKRSKLLRDLAHEALAGPLGYHERQEALETLRKAAEECPHGGGYPLDSLAARNENDPHAGEEGVRCSSCGSRLSAMVWDGGRVTVPCEIRVTDRVGAG